MLCTPCGKGYYASIFTTMVGAKRDSVQVWSAEVFLKVFTPCGGKVVSQPLSFEDSLI